MNTLKRIAGLHLRTNPRWLSVCDIKAPPTGLEVKFSYNWLAGMVLSDIPTSDDRIYSDRLARDPDLAAFSGRMTVMGDSSVTDMQAADDVRLVDGTVIPLAFDLAARLPDTQVETGLRAKASALIGARSEQFWSSIEQLDKIGVRDLGTVLRAS